MKNLENMFNTLLDLVTRVDGLSLNEEIIQRMNGYGSVDGMMGCLQAMCLNDLLRQSEDRPSKKEILIVSHIDTFLNETERSETRNRHSLVSSRDDHQGFNGNWIILLSIAS
jgi:hypothetical protein